MADVDHADGRFEERLGTIPDEALAGRVQHGDQEALEQLVQRYVRPVHAVAASYVSEAADVEDVAQETFLRALQGIDAYDPRRPFAAWLYQIARNVARNHVDMRARWRVEEPSPTLPSPLPGPESLLERAEIRTRLRLAIQQLPEQRRTAFYLSDVEGYPTEEIGRMMGLSGGTVRSHVHHARKALRRALSEGREQVENTGG